MNEAEEALNTLRELMDAWDAREQHIVLVTDPQTGSRHGMGPYPDRLSARVAAMLHQHRVTREDPELADLAYEVVLFLPVEPARPLARGDS